MQQLTTPVFLNEHGDVAIFKSLEAMVAQVEAFDVENGEYEFFDAAGHRLAATVSGYDVTIALDPKGALEAERLEEILRLHFRGLRSHLQDFKQRAAAAASLGELVALCEELAARPRPSLFKQLFRRPPR